MPQQSVSVQGLYSVDIKAKIELLIDNLVDIKDQSGEFLLRLPDGRVIDTKGWNDWEWTQVKFPRRRAETDNLQTWCRPLWSMAIPYSRWLSSGTRSNADLVRKPALYWYDEKHKHYAYLYEETGDQTYLPWLDSWAEWAMYDLPRTKYGGMQHITYLEFNHNELWDDTLMMTVLPLAKIGKLLGRPHYVEEAKRQFLLHIKYLHDPTTGLWFHGWKFDETAPGGVGHNFARARWARGNAWLTIVIPDFIELLDLPPGDALRSHLIDTLEAQCSALRRLQDADGAWRTLLDVPANEGSYVEASATAGFAYGMMKGVRKRYLSQEYEAVALKAVEAVISRIGPDGELADVSFGTGMGSDYQHYKDIPLTSMPYGQSMAMMMLGEFLRKFI